MGPPTSQPSTQPSQPSNPSLESHSVPPALVSSAAGQVPQLGPSAGPSPVPLNPVSRPPSLLHTTPQNSSQPKKGTALIVPTRSSSTPVAIALPSSQGQRPAVPTHNTPAADHDPAQQPAKNTQLPQAEASTSRLGPSPPALEPQAGPSSTERSRPPRKRRRSTATPGVEENVEAPSKPKGGRGRRSRAPSLPPYDPDADPGEDLDPTVVTMASLCEDTGQGRVSSKAAEIQSNHAAWKRSNREKRARMRALMEARKYGRPEEEDEQGQDSTVTPTPASITPSTSTSTNKDGDSGEFDYTQDLAANRYNVQVRIGANGEVVIDEDSLVVNPDETEATANYTHVTESDTTKFVNSGTYAKRFRGSRWSAEETELFYDVRSSCIDGLWEIIYVSQALMQHGENYELIAYMLPGRDRKSCKNKFKVEDKRNPARINFCLNNRTAPGGYLCPSPAAFLPDLCCRYCLLVAHDRERFLWPHARDSRSRPASYSVSAS